MNNNMDKYQRSLQTVRKWYHAHADEYNKARRKKYAEDKEVRDAARQRAREYRAKNKKGRQDDVPLYRYVNSFGEPCDYGTGYRVKVYTTGHIAANLGCTPQRLRNWETKGWIPPAIFSDKHRLYTKKQVRLIERLAAYLESDKRSKKLFEKLTSNIQNDWTKL